MWKVLVVFLLLMIVFATPVSASESLILRGLLPSPETGQEWIAVENLSTASQSATGFVIRDGAGSVKNYSLSGSFEAGELKLLTQTTTKISLNNDTDWVELLKDGVLQSMAEIYEAAPKGQVWFVTSAGWKYGTTAEWEERVASRNWEEVKVEPSPSPEGALVSSATPRPSGSAVRITPTPQPKTVAADHSPPPAIKGDTIQPSFSMPSLLSTFSGTLSAVVSSPVPSEFFPEARSELETLVAWRKQGQTFAWLMLVGGAGCWVFVLPKLWNCYNDLASCIIPFDDSS